MKLRKFPYPYTTLYCLAVILASLGLKYFPGIIILPGGLGAWTPWTLAVGFWFVLRDFCQREMGHYVLLPMAGASIIGAFIVPQFAIAGVTATAVSELADWLIFNLTKKPFHQRVLLSSLVSAPIDSAVFLAVADWFQLLPYPIFSWAGILTGAGAKLVAALIIYFYYKRKLKLS